jgi:STAM-binding protein
MAPHARPPYETQLRQLLLPEQLIATFLQLAHSNTVTGERGLETCAVLGGTLVPGRGGGGGGGGGRSGYMPRALAVTHLIVPKQRGLPDSTEMLAEDELIEAYTTNDVIQLGWIHTHPSQDAFLSSVDLHTHLGYQQLLPESVAVVVAPRCANAFAVFRLTDGEDCVAGRASASGIDVIAACGERGFHSGHMGVEGAEGVVYERSSHVVLDKSLAVTVVDLR